MPRNECKPLRQLPHSCLPQELVGLDDSGNLRLVVSLRGVREKCVIHPKELQHLAHKLLRPLFCFFVEPDTNLFPGKVDQVSLYLLGIESHLQERFVDAQPFAAVAKARPYVITERTLRLMAVRDIGAGTARMHGLRANGAPLLFGRGEGARRSRLRRSLTASS